jgi:hypothetical protein
MKSFKEHLTEDKTRSGATRDHVVHHAGDNEYSIGDGDMWHHTAPSKSSARRFSKKQASRVANWLNKEVGPGWKAKHEND